MTTELASLQKRLQDLNESIQQTISLIQRLSTLQPQGNSFEQPDLSDADSAVETVTDLSAEIHDVLKQQEDDLALLKQDVDDETTPRGFGLGSRRTIASRHEGERGMMANSLAGGCEALAEDLKSTRTRFRNAQLQAKRNADITRQQERTAYLSSLQAAAEALAEEEAALTAAAEAASLNHDDPTYTPPAGHLSPHAALSAEEARKLLLARRSPRPGSSRDRNATQADLALTATSNITASLRRTHALLTSELSRSQFAQETFDSSNAALAELNVRYSGLDDLLARSKGLLGTLLRSQKSDTWYLETACWLLAGTIAWLVFRRLLYGPLWWFVWFPLRLFLRISMGVIGPLFSVVGGAFGGVYGLVAGGKAATAGVPSMVSMPANSMRIMSSVVVGSPARSQAASASVVTGGAVYASSVAGESATLQSPPNSMSDIVGRMVEAASVAGLDGTETEMPLASEMAEAASVAFGSDVFDATAAMPVATEPRTGHSGQQQEGEQNQQERQQNQQQQQDEAQGYAQAPHQEVRRADGQVLRERDPVREPPNPKKRMFEEPPPPSPSPAPPRSTKAFEAPEVRDEL